MKKYVYHVYARYEEYGVGPNGIGVISHAISNTSHLITTNMKIVDDYCLQEIRKALWEKVKDNLLPCFTMEDMQIHSLTFPVVMAISVHCLIKGIFAI